MDDDQQTIARLERFLGDAETPVSEADIAAGTGIGVDTVHRLLYGIMLRYTCTLQVREDGTIVYDFGGRLERIGTPTWRERARGWGATLWRWFSKGYRAALAVMLVLYAVTFVVLLIAAAVAASAASKDDGPTKGSAQLVGAIFRGIFEFTTHTALIYPHTDPFGYRHKQFQSKQPVLGKKDKPKAKSFVASVYDFVLGPARVSLPQGAQEREVAAFVRTHDGVLTVSDIQALSGMSRADAERYFARFTAQFDGDAIITEQGALVSRFPGLLQSASTAQDGHIQFFWDEYEPPFELTGNTSGRNLAIGLLAAFNLFGAAGVLTNTALQGAGHLLLGYVPLALFTLFFAIPLARMVFVYRQNKQQHETNIRKRLYKEVFRGDEDALRFEDVISWANHNKTTEEQLSATAARPLLEATSYELGGTFDMDESDQLVMDTSLLRRERRARAEAAAVAATQLQHQQEVAEQVVFSTLD